MPNHHYVWIITDATQTTYMWYIQQTIVRRKKPCSKGNIERVQWIEDICSTVCWWNLEKEDALDNWCKVLQVICRNRLQSLDLEIELDSSTDEQEQVYRKCIKEVTLSQQIKGILAIFQVK